MSTELTYFYCCIIRNYFDKNFSKNEFKKLIKIIVGKLNLV